MRVLVVDDEPHIVDALEYALSGDYHVRTALSGAEALEAASQSPPHVALLDITMPGMSGMDLLKRMSETMPMTVCVMVTASRDVKTVVEAMKFGAFDYITKPLETQELLVAVEKAAKQAAMRRELSALRDEVEESAGKGDLIGDSTAMREVCRQIGKVASQDVNVLVRGESGSGKELVARAIHNRGCRAGSGFVAVNCALFGSDLTESELFGHEKGAFTGALQAHRGKFEQSDGGTLFLDEICTMSLAAQSKLLRVIEDRKVTRIGGEKTIDVDTRIISATNSDMEQAVREGRFRQDLYFRTAVLRILVPPLRERADDIPLLVDHFIAKHRRRTQSPVRRFSAAAIDALRKHSWPGNVRELENAILTLMCMSEKETVGVEDLDEPVFGFATPARQEAPSEPLTRETLLRELDASGYNLSAAARKLGIHRNTVRNLMERFGILRPASGE